MKYADVSLFIAQIREKETRIILKSLMWEAFKITVNIVILFLVWYIMRVVVITSKDLWLL